MASPEQQMRDLISKIGQKPDAVIYKWGAFELHFYGRAGKGDGEARARRTLSNLHGYMSRLGIDTHAAYVQPIDPRDLERGSMIIVQASAFDKFSRPGAKDMMAGEDFAARLRSLITRFGFRPDEVNVSSRFGVGTISFRNQKGKATELVSKLRGAMKQSGVPESAITAREVQYPADEDGPAEHWGVVNVDFNKMPHSRPGTKARFKVEDRFYFGKGRKERFSDDAKQIADTILKQLGGGRFIAMTGAKNLAFSSNPPGLRMSIGLGAKDKFDNPVDLEMLWKRQPNGDWSAVLWDVKAKKVARTIRTFKTEREAKDFVNAWWQKNR